MFQSFVVPSVHTPHRKIFKYAKKSWHKMKKILVQLAFIPILRDTAALKPGFRAPSPPLITRIFGDRNKSSDGPPYRKIQKEP